MRSTASLVPSSISHIDCKVVSPTSASSVERGSATRSSIKSIYIVFSSDMLEKNKKIKDNDKASEIFTTVGL